MDYSDRELQDIQDALAVETPVENIEWLPTAIREYQGNLTALALAHTDARFFQNRLDEVVGAFNWQSDSKVVGGLFLVGIGIKHPKVDEWIWKWDTGQGEESAGSGFGGGKGVVSGGYKRAGYQWGMGRDLYDYPKMRLRCKGYVGKHDKKNKFSEWLDDPWDALSKGTAESEETGRIHTSRVDSVGEVKASATTFYTIAYGKIKMEKAQAAEMVRPFTGEGDGVTDWDKAIKLIEKELPESERAYTNQEIAKSQINPGKEGSDG